MGESSEKIQPIAIKKFMGLIAIILSSVWILSFLLLSYDANQIINACYRTAQIEGTNTDYFRSQILVNCEAQAEINTPSGRWRGLKQIWKSKEDISKKLQVTALIMMPIKLR